MVPDLWETVWAYCCHTPRTLYNPLLTKIWKRQILLLLYTTVTQIWMYYLHCTTYTNTSQKVCLYPLLNLLYVVKRYTKKKYYYSVQISQIKSVDNLGKACDYVGWRTGNGNRERAIWKPRFMNCKDPEASQFLSLKLPSMCKSSTWRRSTPYSVLCVISPSKA